MLQERVSEAYIEFCTMTRGTERKLEKALNQLFLLTFLLPAFNGRTLLLYIVLFLCNFLLIFCGI